LRRGTRAESIVVGREFRKDSDSPASEKNAGSAGLLVSASMLVIL